MTGKTQHLGAIGESLVATHLYKEGFTVVARNYRIAGGEIDIIAHRKELYVFVEVKTRSTAYFHTSSVVTPKKQACLIYAAKHYIARNQLEEIVIRFDVAIVEGNSEINYISNAFTQESW